MTAAGTSRSQSLSERRDLYEVLQVERRASQEQIKSAYKKAALRYHPDKNAGSASEHAAVRFQEISTAYGVLSDPTKKARYDANGFAGLEPSELDAEVDVSSLGLFGTFAAAMFSRLGVPIKTSIAAGVLEEAYEGRFRAEELTIGNSKAGKAEKAQAAFYELDITQDHIEAGFMVGAASPAGSKFKLLLFEQKGDNMKWELLSQEDSQKAQKGSSMAAALFLDTRTYSLGPKPVLEMARDPDSQLFLRLESMLPRERLPVKPGKLLFAVYNDNWFKRAQFTVTAILPFAHQHTTADLSKLHEIEGRLLAKQVAIHAFESKYKKAKETWKIACEEYNLLSNEVEADILQREEIYLRLLGGKSTEVSKSPVLFQGWPRTSQQ